MCTLNRIIKAMKEKGVSQKQLCEHIGVSKQAFTEWKGGRNESYKKYISEIAEFLNTSTDYLLGFTDDPINYNDPYLIADISTPLLDYFNDDVKKAYAVQQAVDEDAKKEGILSESKASDDDLLELLRNNKNRATIIGFGDGRHIKTDMTYEDFEELEAMWRALKEKRKHDK